MPGMQLSDRKQQILILKITFYQGLQLSDKLLYKTYAI